MEFTDFRSLYNGRLLHIKSFDQHLVDALPKVTDAATDAKLKEAIKLHLVRKMEHLERVENLDRQLGGETSGPDCEAVNGLIKEVSVIVGEVEDKEVFDAAIVGAEQKVEHNEVATYGTAISFEKMLRLTIYVAEPQATLDEEFAADKARGETAEGDMIQRVLTAA